MASGRGLRRTAVVVVVWAALTVVVVPLLVMGRTVWVEGSGRLGDIAGSAGLGAAVQNTFWLALTATALSVPIGTLLALALRRPDLPGRWFWRVAVLLPVLVPDFVLGYSWLRSYGRSGFTDDLIGLHWEGVQGPGGVLAVVTVNAVPLAYLITAVGLAARAEPAAERAARASGAGAFTATVTITLPLLRPAIATAAALIFVLTLGTFAIPLVMGTPSGFSTVTTRIYTSIARSSDPSAFVEAIALALLLVVVAALVVAPTDLLLGPRLRATRAATTDPTSTQSRAGGRWVVAAIGAYHLIGVGLPLLALTASALTRAAGLAPTPANWTLDNFVSVINVRNGAALSRSLVLAAVAATLLVLLGSCVAALERGRAGRGVATLVTLTLVLPGSTLGVGLLLTYGRWLGGTMMIILLAYVAKLWAMAHRPISGALDRLPPDELHAARISGATGLTALRTVVLRPLAPALTGAWLLCFLTALHEVTMSTLLYGPGSETLAVVVLNSQELGRVGVTAALSILLTLILLIPALGFWLLLRRLNRGQRPATQLEDLARAG